MSIEKDLGRIAHALEFIAANMGGAKPAAKVANNDAEGAAPNRDAIKAELTKLGVAFSQKASTVTLQKLLANPPVATEAKAETTIDIPKPDKKAPEVDMDRIRNKLQTFAVKSPENKTQAKAMLAKYKGKKLSDLSDVNLLFLEGDLDDAEMLG